jgi:hypothetical protein
MIVFVTSRGEQVRIRPSHEQDEFEAAMAKDRQNAEFHVGTCVYFTRDVANFYPRTRRGPYQRRVRFTFGG